MNPKHAKRIKSWYKMHEGNLEKSHDMTTAVVMRQNASKDNVESTVNKAGVNRGKGRSVSDKKEFKASTGSYSKLNVPRRELIESQRANEELKSLYDLINLNRAGKQIGTVIYHSGSVHETVETFTTPRGRRMEFVRTGGNTKNLP